MNVVVVESPAKAKTINKYLGSNFTVLASYGHVRDLPSKDGSVDPNQDFAMVWEADPKAQKRINEIAAAVKGSKKLILATDPDREGEAISWHVLELLKNKRVLKDVEIERVVFNAITKSAILEAMKNPRPIDQELVDAYLARRALDYLVGFTLSPVLWRKLPGARSAGRVQSVALRIVCDRELEIEKFVPQEYWTVEADCRTPREEAFKARLWELDGKRVQKFDLNNAEKARAAADSVRAGKFKISNVEAKPVKRNPPPPFTTSTLQQEAARKLGFSASRTMQVAQKLYEGVSIDGETVGLITYMRTDGVQMDESAYAAIRRVAEARFGKKYLPDGPRRYSSKAKNAQEAHEAIRPTDPGRVPDRMNLDRDMQALYDLIWKRAMASQMSAAEMERTTIDIKSAQAALRAVGTIITFDGFLALYQEGQDDLEDDGEGGRLPMMKSGEDINVKLVKDEQHFTEPPPRFSEASLVKKLEELGIGRPSTYASILSVLRDRGYVTLEKNRFIPGDNGRLLTAFLENFFKKYVEYDFTADLEEKLDEVSAGNLNWKTLLNEFWKDFYAAANDASEKRTTEILEALNEALGPHLFPAREDGGDPRTCPACADGRLSLKRGKFGAFIGCSNYPECKMTRALGGGAANENALPAEGQLLGTDPVTNLEVRLKSGRFGPYVQLGEDATPKRSSIPKGWKVEDIDFEKALKLLTLPRDVGPHPEDGVMILANIGRYGPYVQHNKTYANLPQVDEVFEIGLNRAVSLIAEKAAGRGGGRGRTATALKELGAHPESGKALKVLNGRYGPYVSDGAIHATLPRDTDPQSVDMDMAVALIAAKEAKGPSAKKGRAPARTAKPKAAAADKTPKTAKPAPRAKAEKPAKKPAAKKAAPKKTATAAKPKAKKAS
jgi:DNA topoisomerase-1